MTKCDKLTETILDLHRKHFLPLQYTGPEELKFDEDCEYKIVPAIRIHKGNKNEGMNADVIVWNGDDHDFMDGSYYDNCDGVGEGDTLTEALEDLLRKTKRSIKNMKKNLA